MASHGNRKSKINFDKLGILLKEKGLNWQYLRNMGISPGIVNKLKTSVGDVSTITIEKVCNLLECQPSDIMEYEEKTRKYNIFKKASKKELVKKFENEIRISVIKIFGDREKNPVFDWEYKYSRCITDPIVISDSRIYYDFRKMMTGEYMIYPEKREFYNALIINPDDIDSKSVSFILESGCGIHWDYIWYKFKIGKRTFYMRFTDYSDEDLYEMDVHINEYMEYIREQKAQEDARANLIEIEDKRKNAEEDILNIRRVETRRINKEILDKQISLDEL